MTYFLTSLHDTLFGCCNALYACGQFKPSKPIWIASTAPFLTKLRSLIAFQGTKTSGSTTVVAAIRLRTKYVGNHRIHYFTMIQITRTSLILTLLLYSHNYENLQAIHSKRCLVFPESDLNTKMCFYSSLSHQKQNIVST